MLLYDALLRHAYEHCQNPHDGPLLETLGAAEVFALSNVVPLLPDWEHGKSQPISKRPPFKNLWAEWSYHETWQGEQMEWDMGALLVNASRDDVMTCLGNNVGPYCSAESIREFLDDYEEWYVARRFLRLRTTTHEGMRSHLGRLSALLGAVVFAMRDEATVVRNMIVLPSRRYSKADERAWKRYILDTWATFGLPLVFGTHERTSPMAVPWPPLMAFALLQCHNVSRERIAPPPKLARQVVRRGHPPLCTYHVLRLHVQPQERLVAGESDISDKERRRRRFHLCRGHFKFLQHERFQQKGWHWWPAHWRGDPLLGVAQKDYAIVP